MSFTNKFVKVYKALLPSPFTIAIVLSFLAFILALLFGKGTPGEFKPLTVLKYWENGLWNNNLIVFAMQMMLMLVLGHVLALSKPINHFINSVVVHLNNTSIAASVVAFLTMSVAFFNWGLGLIFGAILARKVAEQALKNNWKINYPLIGAAGYSGLMVWHGGFSGSSLAKVAESGHLASLFPTASFTNELPQAIIYSETVFSSLNIFISVLLLLIVPIALFFLGKKSPSTPIQLNSHFEVDSVPMISGAEKLDHSKILSFSFGSILLIYVLYKIFWVTGFDHFFTPNNINLLLLSLGILFHGDFYRFLKAVDEAISGASGILIQFPLYFGIMGIMRDSELISMFSNYISSISGPTSFTFFTFFSAGVVNILVPSGGGQWAIQGPLLIQTAHDIGAPYAKNILAFAYGDQLTNMLQPFWALPLLGITNLKAKQILPYSLFLFIIGLIIFAVGLLIF
ncbi:short-chain fatty acid transporter [bacterium SCSIO 12643]|nr:short-chain fatty acid transporter [bacterium SCSIO 12643]